MNDSHQNILSKNISLIILMFSDEKKKESFKDIFKNTFNLQLTIPKDKD